MDLQNDTSQPPDNNEPLTGDSTQNKDNTYSSTPSQPTASPFTTSQPPDNNESLTGDSTQNKDNTYSSTPSQPTASPFTTSQPPDNNESLTGDNTQNKDNTYSSTPSQPTASPFTTSQPPDNNESLTGDSTQNKDNTYSSTPSQPTPSPFTTSQPPDNNESLTGDSTQNKDNTYSSTPSQPTASPFTTSQPPTNYSVNGSSMLGVDANQFSDDTSSNIVNNGNGIVVGGTSTSSATGFSPIDVDSNNNHALKGKSIKQILKKPPVIGAIVLIVLIAGILGVYFGYYMNPSVIWSESLNNANTADTKFLSYMRTAAADKYAGASVNGTFSGKESGQSFSGDFNEKSYKGNDQINANINSNKINLNLQAIGIANKASSYPNVYLKVNGINDVGNLLGLGSEFSSLNNQWIELNGNLISGMTNSLSTNKTNTNFNWSNIVQFLQNTEGIDKKYLFSTNSSYAVFRILKQQGFQTVNGVHTYLYDVGFNKTNLGDYGQAVCSSIENSSLSQSLSSLIGSAPTDIKAYCGQLKTAVKNINANDNIEVWVNTSDRLVYQVKLPSIKGSGETYVGLNYSNNNPSLIPVFIEYSNNNHTSHESFNLNMTLSENTNTVNIAANLIDKSQFNAYNFKFNLSFKPNNSKLNIVAPSNTVPLTTVLSKLGFDNSISSTPLSSSSNTQVAL